eukprot:GSA25T00027162001.1
MLVVVSSEAHGLARRPFFVGTCEKRTALRFMLVVLGWESVFRGNPRKADRVALYVCGR